jgi:hypothetical protein
MSTVANNDRDHQNSRSKAEYHAVCRTILGNQYITGFSGVQRLEGTLFPDTLSSSTKRNDYIGAIPAAVQQWADTQIGNNDRPMSLCLVGPSRPSSLAR